MDISEARWLVESSKQKSKRRREKKLYEQLIRLKETPPFFISPIRDFINESTNFKLSMKIIWDMVEKKK